ncbi:MAG: response regulator [Candidatus Omnitrophota bacterium]|nr:response regulator [Candidatus Omnitrophota bacterium]
MSDTKVLIIDDSEQDRKIITRFVKKAGYDNMTCAVTGEEGVEKAKEEQPDLIILDTVLPGIKGFEVCRKIRQLEGIKRPKIVMQTGSIDDVDALRAKEAGVDEYCVKTMDCGPLLEAIKRMMGV